MSTILSGVRIFQTFYGTGNISDLKSDPVDQLDSHYIQTILLPFKTALKIF